VPKRPLNQSLTIRVCAVAIVLATAAGCANTPRSSQEAASVLSRPGQARETYFAAIEAARTFGPSPETTAALRRMVAADGYAIDARVMAFDLRGRIPLSASSRRSALSGSRSGDSSARMA